jgi:hypothetical protein
MTNDWYVLLSYYLWNENPIRYQFEFATIHFTFDSNVIIDGIAFLSGNRSNNVGLLDPSEATAYYVDETTKEEKTFFF